MDSDFLWWRWLAGPAEMMMGLLAMVTVASPVVLYVVARWRAHRDPEPDPQLGLKFALHYFTLLAFQVLLVGLAVALYAATSGTHDSGTILRVALGLMVPAIVVIGAQLAVLGRTNDGAVTAVRRLFVGFNLLTTGVIAFAGIVASFEILLAKDGGGGVGYATAAVALVYGVAWVALAALLGNLVLGRSAPALGAMTAVALPLHRD